MSTFDLDMDVTGKLIKDWKDQTSCFAEEIVKAWNDNVPRTRREVSTDGRTIWCDKGLELAHRPVPGMDLIANLESARGAEHLEVFLSLFPTLPDSCFESARARKALVSS